MSGRCVFGLIADAYLPIERVTMSSSSQTLACVPSVYFEEVERWETGSGCLALAGDSRAMRRLRLQVERIGPHFRTVMLRGEMGTGKERVARALDDRTGSAGDPFVVRHATSLSELVADENNDSIRTLAQTVGGGTLFVDRAEDLSPGAQWLLLRLLEQRVGLRLIASTSRDLRRLMTAGRFVEELYHRLAMVEITIEPLRGRREDIPGLAMQLVGQFAVQYDKRIDSIASDALVILEKHTWPGNLRELENVVRNGVLRCEGISLGVDDLSLLVEPTASKEDHEIETPQRLQDVIDRHVLHVMRECSGNKVRAAEVLGISRSTLYRMLEGCSSEG
jgi:DNA-binding NtrC family response regulator